MLIINHKLYFCTLYKALGVEQKANQQLIKESYLKLAKLHHPDVADQTKEVDFKEITNAYNILKDPAKRQQYDDLLIAKVLLSNIQSLLANGKCRNIQKQISFLKQQLQRALSAAQRILSVQTSQPQFSLQNHKLRKKNRLIDAQLSKFMNFLILQFVWFAGGIFTSLLYIAIIPKKQIRDFEPIKKHDMIDQVVGQLNQKLIDSQIPKTATELNEIYNSIQDIKKQKIIDNPYNGHLPTNQYGSEIRRQNLILSKENINDPPHRMESRKKQLEQEMKDKKFKIEVEHWEHFSKGEVKRLQKKTTKKEKRTQGQMNLQDFAKQHSLNLSKNQAKEELSIQQFITEQDEQYM